MRALSILRRASLLAVIALLASATPAFAASGHPPVVFADFLGIGHAVGSVFGGIGHALLGAFSWTFKLAAKFILVTIGALVKLLIPASWAREGVQIMRWIVAVPDYAGTVTSPGGAHVYGFAGINELRDLFTWIGAGLLPLTLVYATSRAMVGHGDHVAIPLVRVAALGALLLSYPYWWAQAAALVNEMTNLVLSLPAVTTGLHKLMLYAVDGVALGGWQLIDLALMAAIGFLLLSLIFLKVVIILLGALLYATGPITIGLVPTDSGAAISRAWLSAAGMLLLLPVMWAAVFAVGALLVNDAGTAGPLIAGNSDVGSLLGGVLLAVAGLASLWVCLRVAREAGSLMRIQLGGMLALARGRNTAVPATSTSSSAVQSLRSFTSRVSQASNAAAGALAQSGSAGALTVRGGGLIAGAGRRGVVGSAAAATRGGIAAAAPPAAMLIGRSRAGAVAVQMARAGTASWQSTGRAKSTSSGQEHQPNRASAPPPTSGERTSAERASTGPQPPVPAPGAAQSPAAARAPGHAPTGSTPALTRPAARSDSAPSGPAAPASPSTGSARSSGAPQPPADDRPSTPPRTTPNPPPRTPSRRGKG